ncbi:hypothetical protein [Streptomyces fagopyri]|uniref:hypothetical protein n=1 Tax=Streptomyces fagopyri TaxID=2662397 RepID=UPI003808D92F
MTGPQGEEKPPLECGHWIGAERRYCLARDDLRRYQPGLRCPAHTPAALAGRREPGIPAVQPS